MNFLKKLFGQSEPKKNYEPKITVEKIQQVFEYGKRENLTGTGDDSLRGKYKVGHLINWKSEEHYFKGYNDIPAQNVPAHINGQIIQFLHMFQFLTIKFSIIMEKMAVQRFIFAQ